jgi:hypothetical protein
MVIQTTCKKCGTAISLDFGELSKEEAIEAAEKLDRSPRECPGRHIEISGMGSLWAVKEAIHRAYDLGEGIVEAAPVMSDHDFVQGLLSEGNDVYDGGQNRVPEFNLPSIHATPDLKHLGFGDFGSDTHLFLRQDSPRGTRFYTREKRTGHDSASPLAQ